MARYSRRETSAMPAGPAATAVSLGLYRGQDGALLFFAGPQHRNYAVLDFDRKLNFAQTVIYDLPAGRGHQYFSQGPLLYVLGGWRVSAVVQAVSGLPFTVTSTSATPGTTQTGDLVAPFQVTHNVNGAGTATWFNPASFAAPAK